ncbi:MAG: hypothetical protein Q8900_09660 [Bacillota bacterium]|nr:hypothetical protein [Bacillota bacterium]
MVRKGIETGSENVRNQAYDETIKNLERKDCKILASLAIPEIEEAEELDLKFAELSMADMNKADYIAKVNLKNEKFILHMEFESNFKSNSEMIKRMLRYFIYIYQNEDLPIYQVLVILKEASTKNILDGFESTVQNELIMKYKYKIVKVYEFNKYDFTKEGKEVLFPLRVFMKHGNETDEEHIAECLQLTESLEDKDFYYLTAECIKKYYSKDKFEKVKKFIKEEIYMSSALFKDPYEYGVEKGIEKGIEKGSKQELLKNVTKLLTKKFGILPSEIRVKIEKSEAYNLEIILDEIFNLEKLADVLKFLK